MEATSTYSSCKHSLFTMAYLLRQFFLEEPKFLEKDIPDLHGKVYLPMFLI